MHTESLGFSYVLIILVPFQAVDDILSSPDSDIRQYEKFLQIVIQILIDPVPVKNLSQIIIQFCPCF